MIPHDYSNRDSPDSRFMLTVMKQAVQGLQDVQTLKRVQAPISRIIL